jgi:hypothetical protein
MTALHHFVLVQCLTCRWVQPGVVRMVRQQMYIIPVVRCEVAFVRRSSPFHAMKLNAKRIAQI